MSELDKGAAPFEPILEIEGDKMIIDSLMSPGLVDGTVELDEMVEFSFIRTLKAIRSLPETTERND